MIPNKLTIGKLLIIYVVQTFFFLGRLEISNLIASIHQSILQNKISIESFILNRLSTMLLIIIRCESNDLIAHMIVYVMEFPTL